MKHQAPCTMKSLQNKCDAPHWKMSNMLKLRILLFVSGARLIFALFIMKMDGDFADKKGISFLWIPVCFILPY